MKNGWFWHQDRMPRLKTAKPQVVSRLITGLSTHSGWEKPVAVDFWRAFMRHFELELLENGFLELPGIGLFWVDGPYQRWMDLADGRFSVKFRLSKTLKAKLHPTAVEMARQRRKAGLKDPLKKWQQDKKLIRRISKRLDEGRAVDHDRLPD